MEKIKNEISAQAVEYMKHREYLISIFFFYEGHLLQARLSPQKPIWLQQQSKVIHV